MKRTDRAAILLAALLCAAPSTPGQAAPDPLAPGKQALLHQQWSAAHKFFATYLQDHPGSVEAQFYLGNAALGAKQYAEAEQTYKKILANYPRDWAAHSNLSEVYAAQQRWIEFDTQRKLLIDAQQQHQEGWQQLGNDVIDVLHVGGERYSVREYYPLAGGNHTRYDFLHFDKQGKLDSRIACESDDADQAAFTKRYPRKAAAGERSFSLVSYAGNAHATLRSYPEGEPSYSTVRADVIRALTAKTGPFTTITVDPIPLPRQPAPPKP
jgi:tetratricopeptide (TPR) repeat protein